jgi:prevent-host-death family protein
MNVPLSKVRANLSSLVRKASHGASIGVTVRGAVVARLVPPQGEDARARKSARALRGSLRLVKPLDAGRAAYLKWLGVDG